MTVNPQRLTRLQEYGLTEYEGRAYLALLDLEKAEASHIADLSRVPRTKIYQALEGLETKRLVKVIPERPKRYVVQPFTGYLDELEKGLRNRADAVGNDKDALATEFAPRGRVVVEDAGGFLVIKGRANIASKLSEMLAGARKDASVLASGPAARRLAYHAETLSDKNAAGLRLRVLTQDVHELDAHLEPLAAHVELRNSSVAFGAVTMLFVDDREMLLAHHVPDDHHYFQGSDVAFWTNDAALVSSLKALFVLAWTTAGAAPTSAAARAAERALAAAIAEMRMPA